MAPVATDELPRTAARLLEAVEKWLRDPAPPARRRLAAALAARAAARGIAGIHVSIDTPPLPPLALGVGSLRRPPAPKRRSAMVHRQLRNSRADRPRGELWIDPTAPTPSGDALFAAEERLDGGSARAHVEVASEAVLLGGLLDVAIEADAGRRAVQAAEERLAALDEATRAIAGVLSAERVLQLIVDNVRRLLGAQYAALGILDEARLLDPFVTSGISRAVRERIGPPPTGHGLLGLIVEEGRSLRIPDIARHPRSVGFPPHHPPMTSLLGVPVVVRGRVIGDLYLSDRIDGRPFDEPDQHLAELFANHAGIAIENARLHEQEQRLAILEERQRIGRDLHDGIIQSIYAVGLMLDDASELMTEAPDEAQTKIDRAVESLNLTIRDIRNFIFGLRPDPFDQAGLIDALKAMTEEFRVNTMVDIALSVDVPGGFDMRADQSTQLLHLAREALSNVARHARATHAEIAVTATDRALEVAIVDDGVGFDPAARRGPGHMGLSNMRTRAADLGGELRVESAVGRGTQVIVRVPRDQEDRDPSGEQVR